MNKLCIYKKKKNNQKNNYKLKKNYMKLKKRNMIKMLLIQKRKKMN